MIFTVILEAIFEILVILFFKFYYYLTFLRVGGAKGESNAVLSLAYL